MHTSLLLALSSSIGFALGTNYCVEAKSGFDAKFYSYPLGDESTLLAGSFYFQGGYKTKGNVIATTHGVTDIRAHQDVDSGFFPKSENGTVYGQDVSVTNFGVVLTGYFYAEQSGVYKFTLPADHSGIGIQFGAGISSDNFNTTIDAVAHSTEQIAEGGDDSSDVVQDLINDYKNGLQRVNYGNKAGSLDTSPDTLKNALGSVKSTFFDAFTVGPSWFSTTTSVTESLPLIEGQYYPVRVVYFHPSGTMDISLPWTMPNGRRRADFNNVYQWDIEIDKCHGPPQKTTFSTTRSTSTAATPGDISTGPTSIPLSPSSVPSVSHSLPVPSTSGAVPIPIAGSSSIVHANSAPGGFTIGYSSQYPLAPKTPNSNLANTIPVTSKSGVLPQQSNPVSPATQSSNEASSTSIPSATIDNGKGSSSWGISSSINEGASTGMSLYTNVNGGPASEEVSPVFPSSGPVHSVTVASNSNGALSITRLGSETSSGGSESTPNWSVPTWIVPSVVTSGWTGTYPLTYPLTTTETGIGGGNGTAVVALTPTSYPASTKGSLTGSSSVSSTQTGTAQSSRTNPARTSATVTDSSSAHNAGGSGSGSGSGKNSGSSYGSPGSGSNGATATDNGSSDSTGSGSNEASANGNGNRNASGSNATLASESGRNIGSTIRGSNSASATSSGSDNKSGSNNTSGGNASSTNSATTTASGNAPNSGSNAVISSSSSNGSGASNGNSSNDASTTNSGSDNASGNDSGSDSDNGSGNGSNNGTNSASATGSGSGSGSGNGSNNGSNGASATATGNGSSGASATGSGSDNGSGNGSNNGSSGASATGSGSDNGSGNGSNNGSNGASATGNSSGNGSGENSGQENGAGASGASSSSNVPEATRTGSVETSQSTGSVATQSGSAASSESGSVPNSSGMGPSGSGSPEIANRAAITHWSLSSILVGVAVLFL